jgi:hypothetical protein
MTIFTNNIYDISINNIYFISFSSYINEVFPDKHYIYNNQKSNITDKNIADKYLDQIIEKIALLCKEHNLTYDSFHNHLFLFYNGIESAKIKSMIKKRIDDLL